MTNPNFISIRNNVTTQHDTCSTCNGNGSYLRNNIEYTCETCAEATHQAKWEQHQRNLNK